MAYLGNLPAEAYTTTVKDSFNGDGSTVAFTMSQPSTTNNVRVVVENVIQDPTVAYTCSGTTLTFTSAPPSGTNNIYVVHLGPAVMTTVPPTEITEATTYTSDLTVQGAFTSQGIDDNATSTTMTLDSSGHTMFATTDNVVQTNSGTGNGGVVIRGGSNPYLAVASDGSAAGEFNRLASDGPVVQFRKDGTVVGSIFSSGGQYVGLGSGDVGLLYLGAADDIRPWNPSTNLARDNAIDLGNSDARFKDLYLSGGVYLGGTGSANHLDDYEEGSWEPEVLGTSTDPTVTYHGDNGGYYIKVGRMVYLMGTVRWTALSGGSGNFNIGNLPFGNSARTNGDNADAIGAARTVVWGGTSTRTPTAVGMRSSTTNLNVFATRYDNAAHTVTISDLGSTGMVQFTVIVYTG